MALRMNSKIDKIISGIDISFLPWSPRLSLVSKEEICSHLIPTPSPYFEWTNAIRISTICLERESKIPFELQIHMAIDPAIDDPKIIEKMALDLIIIHFTHEIKENFISYGQRVFDPHEI